jgi:hypothetical protein
MYNRSIAFHLCFVFSLFLTLFSCKTIQKNKTQTTKTASTDTVSKTVTVTEKATPIIDHKFAKTLIKNLKENEFQFRLLSAKMHANVSIDGKENNFNSNIRIKKDSLIWISFSLLGIEGARLLATTDSVKFIDRINSKYFIGDYEYISKLFQTDIDFFMLQAVLVGNSIDFYDEDNKLKSYIEDGIHILSTNRKKRIKKLLTQNEVTQNAINSDPIQRMYISPSNYKIMKVLINDLQTSRTFEGKYSDFIDIGGKLLPQEINYNISATKTIILNAKYSKIELVDELKFPFAIPSSYKNIIE